MVSATDGSAFTGSVTVYVTGDAGTQAVGSVGSGACTHEGNGYHTYAPAQAETNYDLVAFTFIGTGAVPSTVQMFTDGGSGSGSGTGTYTDTIKDPSNNPLDGARVQLSTDAAGTHRVYEAFTNALGVFVMNPDPGTYYRWIDLAGYTDRLTQGAQVTVT